MPVIVFEHRKDKIVWLFAPRDPHSRATEYEAFSVNRVDFVERKVASLHCPTNYYIVDSSQAEHRSSAPCLLPAITIFVCSPDLVHYSEWLKDLQRGFRIYCPSWSRAAVLAARPYVQSGVALSEEEVIKRGEIVGWNPRRVFAADADFANFKLKIDTALCDNQADIEAVLRVGAEGIEADRNHADKPRSSIFCYGVLDGSNYRTPTIHFVSDYARLRVGFNVLKLVFSSIQNNVDKRRAAECGDTFEKLVFVWLRNGCALKLTPLLPDGEPLSVAVQKGGEVLPSGEAPWDKMYLKMKDMPLWDGKSKAPMAAPVLAAGNFPLIDVADARNRGFNMTVGATHKSPTVAQVERLRNKLGLNDSQFLHIVYLVLPAHFASFNVPLDKTQGEFDSIRLYKAEVPSPLSRQGEKVWRQALTTHSKEHMVHQEKAHLVDPLDGKERETHPMTPCTPPLLRQARSSEEINVQKETMLVRDLQEELKRRGIPFAKKMNKAQLVDLLNGKERET